MVGVNTCSAGKMTSNRPKAKCQICHETKRLCLPITPTLFTADVTLVLWNYDATAKTFHDAN